MRTLPQQFANACFDNAVRNAAYLSEVEGREYSVVVGVNELGVHWVTAVLNEDGSLNEYTIVDGDNPLDEVQRVLPLAEAVSLRAKLLKSGESEYHESNDNGRQRLCALAPNPLTV